MTINHDARIDAFYADMTREYALDALDHIAEVEASEPDPDTAPDPEFADYPWPVIVEILDEIADDEREGYLAQEQVPYRWM